MSNLILFALGGLGVFLALTTVVAISLRRVVRTNMVHIVQSSKKTTSYGKDQIAGNVYYEFPAWMPFLGVQVIKLPMSNFDLSLESYNAYDVDRVPFVVDVVAFFRIEDSGVAAQRVSDMRELEGQLRQIVQGAVRKVLAAGKIERIMGDRAEFGDAFTDEVEEQLKSWGVVPVKAMELMDIRDPRDGSSEVISNIMAKEQSRIEMESRQKVAANTQAAETAEIAARQIVDIRDQEAQQKVGERTAEKVRQVGIANEQATQEVLSEKKVTKERDMEVVRVQEVKNAEIEKDREVVKAEEDRQTSIITAEGSKDAQILTAQGDLETERLKAQGIEAVGAAEAEAKRLEEMATVQPQIALATEIGENEGYQSYLVKVEQVNAAKEVGVEQAAALEKADVKIIANAGNATEGMASAMDIFTSKGGTNFGAALEAFAQTPLGGEVVDKIVGSKNDAA